MFSKLRGGSWECVRLDLGLGLGLALCSCSTLVISLPELSGSYMVRPLGGTKVGSDLPLGSPIQPAASRVGILIQAFHLTSKKPRIEMERD